MSENIPPANTVSNQRLVRKQERTLSIRTVMGDVAEHNVAPRPLLQKLRKVQEKTQNTQNIQNTESTTNAELGSKRKRDGSKKINDDEKDEIKNLNGYQKLSKIGEGTYGIVFKALHKSTNKIVALKKVRLTYSEGIPVTAMREIAILKEMHHNNVIGLTDLIQLETCVYLVTDYLEMDMRRYMIEAGRDGLTPQHIKSFMHQLLSGLCYCHSHRILHRDLKPQNLLIDRNGKLTIADLGLSRAFGVPMRTYTHQVITLWYRPPEILLGSRHYSTAVDLWSVGCIFAEMMTMKPVFPGDSQIDELFRIFRLLGTPTEEMWPGVTTLPDYQGMFPVWSRKNLKEAFRRYPGFIELDDYAFNLLEQLLDYDPCYRISAKKALEHPYFYTDITTLKF